MALAGGLVACGTSNKGADQSTTASARAEATPVEATQMPETPAGLEAFYNQDLKWEECDKEYQCATAKAPLDYDNPDGKEIDIALKKLPASSGKPIGTLFLNPGGPGGSGVEFVAAAKLTFSPDLLSAFDVVGFDPRGVGDSTGIKCQADGESDGSDAKAGTADAAGSNMSSAEETERGAADLAARCEEHTKPAELLDHVDTVSVAKDLDMLRALAGDPRLYYMGFSYGTLLGATYAEHFPGNVGRLVLDGGVDPSISLAKRSEEQAVGFEKALETFVNTCQQQKACPFAGDTKQGVQELRGLLDELDNNPIPVDGKDNAPVTGAEAKSVLLNAFYEDQLWPNVFDAFAKAKEGDGTSMRELAELLADQGGGKGDAVQNAIDCMDYPVEGDRAQWDQQAAELKQKAPVFGDGYIDLYCQTWGHHGTEKRAEIKAKGAAPILVVGTTGDPATPHHWSEALAKQLESGSLLTWEGNGHTAYGRAGECVTSAVDGYLLRGVMPEDGKVCTG
ncbi:alpha/beta hydrolase [Actinobaculum sp. 352]|nr:alpha/beta hydrolase [Actinobaculum sp. 313]RTE50964.1 alpha/beta hydrolase [Actinobaculum sp. 352]